MLLTTMPAACLLLCATLAASTAASAAPAIPHHAISAIVTPAAHTISVTDTIRFGAPVPRYVFALHRNLTVTADAPARLRAADLSDCGLPPTESIAACHEIAFATPSDSVTLRYKGVIHHPVTQQPGEMRASAVTAGVISADGVFLDAGAYWYPIADHDLLNFTLDARVAAPGWDIVSQGRRNEHARDATGARVVWHAAQPQDDIYLVAGPYHEYAANAGDIPLQVLLRAPDDGLARQYLDAGADYLMTYQRLLGPYPHEKFAVVENFWETGYGMPSFTLLGAKVIRLPFILHSSYPHEILHNWFGNGVYVDYAHGNWSEGLTSYLADHLIREQHGDAAEYRRATLQKYGDYVREHDDFALTRFTSRHSSASEAVGYGKTMMMWHMLRQRVGDDAFLGALRRFYVGNRHRRASFDDLRRAFEETTGRNYRAFFDQWTTRTGAPRLAVRDVAVARAGGGWRLDFVLEQTQSGPEYALSVPVAITLDGVAEAYMMRVTMNERSLRVRHALPARPLRVDVDPEFDVFRSLAPDERPATLSQVLGATRITMVVPGDIPDDARRRYAALAAAWPSRARLAPDVVRDDRITALPHDGAVVVVGWENRFRDAVLRGVAAAVEPGHLTVDGKRLPRAGLSVAIVTADADRAGAPLLWLSPASSAAIPGLLRKLPHYGKYSYLLFDGDAPDNIARGVWTVTDSSLSVVVQDPDGGAAPSPRAQLAKRPALTAAAVAGDERTAPSR